jgi:predicted DCC family thiol-disulfide oxidoreductase YuxK
VTLREGDGRLIVLYDADCGICTLTARYLERWDRQDRLEALPLQAAASDPRPAIRSAAASHPLHDELHVVDEETGELRSGGSAVLEIVGRLPNGRVPTLLGRLPPAAWVVGLGYGLVARNRMAISRALRLQLICRVPAVSARSRR